MPKQSKKNDRTGLEIAVIGMAGRFPGAQHIDEFWENLKNGVESISFFSDEELAASGVEPVLLQKPDYVKAQGILERVDCFDPSFFGYTPTEALLMVPQMRLFHECTWHALEDAGYDPDSYDGLIGLYAGASSSSIWEALSFLSGKGGELGEFSTALYTDKDKLSTRISYDLNLKGPSFTVQTACSTSLVAIHLACQGLLSGECQMAVAGGVTISTSRKFGYLFREGSIYSPDGHCKAFDERANGTVNGEGLGAVVLKLLEQATADRDYVYAVVKGSAINNDGNSKVGYTAPSVKGQVAVIQAAQQAAEVEPESIGYVETHGTGTEMGDPIEVEALRIAFNTEKRRFCRIGSVKTNVGHLIDAAGVTGFIKTVLALKHRCIPPSLNYKSPNPKIDFANSPFYVNTQLSKWEGIDGFPLRAGVSSFGIGGTNAHTILEEAPEREDSLSTRPVQLLLFSARTQPALRELAHNLMGHFKGNPTLNLADAAYTLQIGRRASLYRQMLLCGDVAEAAEMLSYPESKNIQAGVAEVESRPVVFMFPGQGSQYVNMGLELYCTEPAFRQEMDRCFAILQPLLGYDLKEILYPGSSDRIQTKKINQTELAQPLIFTIEYALARLLMLWGIRPQAMIGHSIGEFTAACLSGVLSLEDGLSVVVLRGKLMQRLPTGTMLSVALSEGELKPLMSEGLSLAAVNSPCRCVVSGALEVVSSFQSQLEERGCENRLLHTSHAFHSAMMDPMLEEFEERVGQIRLNAPQIPYISNVSGRYITAEEALNPGYWARQVRSTVRFADGIEELVGKEAPFFLEIGPGKSLSTFVKQSVDRDRVQMIMNLIRHPGEKVSDARYLLDKIGRLWLQGNKIDWNGFYQWEKRYRVPLPGYPFEKKHFWIDADISKQEPLKQPHWFSVSSWKSSLLPNAEKSEALKQSPWLLFVDDCGLGLRLAGRLEEAAAEVTIVQAGSGFTREAERLYTLDPQQSQAYEMLLGELARLNKFPRNIVHLWSVGKDERQELMFAYLDKALNSGFHSLIYLAQAIGKKSAAQGCRIQVVANNMQEVTGQDLLYPEKATLLGPAKVIGQEFTNLYCRTIDVDMQDSADSYLGELTGQLFREITSGAVDPVVAYRHNRRWLQVFEPVELNRPPAKIPRLRDRGVYLITGGTGGIGLVLAEHLAKTVKARLVLVGRRLFPQREEWAKWLEDGDKDDKISLKIRKLMELENMGAEVMIGKADVANQEQMKEVIDAALARYGQINGVIHSAGVSDGAVIQRRTREMSEKVLAPKVRGLIVIDRILKDVKLDFFLLCSSLASILAPVGQAGYCGANAFLDAFALHDSSRNGRFTVSINWDAWGDVGMAVEALQPESQKLVEIPLLESCLERDDHLAVYAGRFNVNRCWVLNEHRPGGKAVLPGTAYLELIGAVYEKAVEGNFIEMRKVNFLTPLLVKEGAGKEVRLILKEIGDCFEFRFISQIKPGEDEWQEHCRGEVSDIDGYKARRFDIEEIEKACGIQEVIKPREASEFSSEFVTLGPRWNNFKWIKYGQDRGLALLELPEKFVPDIQLYKLHPALLDTATSFLSGKFKGSDSYLPVGYERIRVMGSMPQKVLSYMRCVDDNQPGKETLRFDITVMDEQGIGLIDIEGLTLRRVKVDSFVDERPHSQHGELTTPAPEQSSVLEIGSPGLLHSLRFRPVARQKPGFGEVEIKVRVSGLNFRDVLLAMNLLPPPLDGRIKFGFECAGEIVALGAGVNGFKIGEEVIAFASDCFGSYVVTSASSVVSKPDFLSFEEAATIPLAFVTAYYGLTRLGKLSQGEKVLIHAAAGGVGMAAVQIGRWIGADIFATAGSPVKRNFLHSLGIEYVMDSRSLAFADEIKKITDNRGVDVVLNSLAGEFVPRSLSVLAPYGRFIEIGIRDIYSGGKLALQPFQKSLSYFALILSTKLPGFKSLFCEVIQHFEKRNFRPLPLRVFPTNKVAQAFEYMAAAKHIGKIVVCRPGKTQLSMAAVGGSHPYSYFISSRESSLKDRTVIPHERLKGELQRRGISTSEGIDVFNRVISSGFNQVVVSCGDLQYRLEQLLLSRPISELDNSDEEELSSLQSRPTLPNPYISPRNHTEQILVEIWVSFFGIEKVGITDNFFDLGGDSLKAMAVVARIQNKLNVDIAIADILNRPTIETLAEYIGGLVDNNCISIEPIEEKAYYRLSSAQRRLYFLQQMGEDNVGYNQSQVVLLEGELKQDKLEAVLRELIERHESLRTSIHMIDDEPVQQIHKEVPFAVEYYDLEQGETEAEKWRLGGNIVARFVRPFDLTRAPLFRVGLIKLEDKQHIFMLDMHHIITDGISMRNFVGDFLALYINKEFAKLRIRYRDYSEWQIAFKQRETIKLQEEFWLGEFAGEIPVLDLPTDYVRPAVQSYEGGSLNFEIGREETRALRAIASEAGATIFMMLLALYNVLLSKISGQKDIVIGTPIAGRRDGELQKVIGLFVNTLALRNYPSEGKTFRQFLNEVKERTLAAFRNQDLVFEDLVKRVVVRRDPGRNPLFDVLFSMQNFEIQEVKVPGLKLKKYEYEDKNSKYDLIFYATEAEERFICAFKYGLKLFKEETIKVFIRYFLKIIAVVSEDPHKRIAEIDVTSMEKRQEIQNFLGVDLKNE
jgi:acyl transferase domain-containing protein/NADPH:quinone reductase-like Zn-dependent oxidoreductase/acyl carrier protein